MMPAGSGVSQTPKRFFKGKGEKEYKMKYILNEHSGVSDVDILGSLTDADAQRAMRFHKSLPMYQPTKLEELRMLAEQLG